MRSFIFIALIVTATFAYETDTDASSTVKYQFEGKSYSMAQLNNILKEQKIWPDDMKERYSRRVLVGGPECKAYFSCRDTQELKDCAYCLASKLLKAIPSMPKATNGDSSYATYDTPSANTIYYAETQKKSGSTNDYTQFLFARLPIDYMKFYDAQRNKDVNLRTSYKAFLFTVCVPVNINEEAVAFGHCIFDTCQNLMDNMKVELANDDVKNSGKLRQSYGNKLNLQLDGFTTGANIVDSNKDEIFALKDAAEKNAAHKARMAACNQKYNENNVETTYIFAFQQDLKDAQKVRDDKAKEASTFRFMQETHKTHGFKIRIGEHKSHFIPHNNIIDPTRCANRVNLKKIE